MEGFLADEVAGMFDQQLQRVELLGRQIDRGTVAIEPALTSVER